MKKDNASQSVNEFSYGVIPLKHIEGVWHVLLVQHSHGDHWGFPKGHANPGESPKETAARELKEETGLHIKSYINEEAVKENYHIIRNYGRLLKQVAYYIAEVDGEFSLQYEEVKNGKWVPLSEAHHHVTFQESKNICRYVQSLF